MKLVKINNIYFLTEDVVMGNKGYNIIRNGKVLFTIDGSIRKYVISLNKTLYYYDSIFLYSLCSIHKVFFDRILIK